MVEYALEELMSGDDARRRALVRRMCLKFPSVPALSMVFALTSAASMVEDNLSRESDCAAVAAFGFKLAALLAGDVYAVESMGYRPARSHDLLHFWRRVDGYFLDL